MNESKREDPTWIFQKPKTSIIFSLFLFVKEAKIRASNHSLSQ